MEAASTRYEQAFAEVKKQSEVVQTAKTVIALLPGANTPLPLAEAAAKLERAIKETEQQAATAYQKLTTSGMTSERTYSTPIRTKLGNKI